MKKYILTKTQKGRKFLYEVKDENGNVISKRTSVRDNYIAATSNGEFYFGRIDLIGKGEHGRILNQINDCLNHPKELYEKLVKSFIPSYRNEWKKENPFDKWYKSIDLDDLKIRKNDLESIAYLKSGE